MQDVPPPHKECEVDDGEPLTCPHSPTSELGFQGHIQNCIMQAEDFTEEQGLASIVSVGLCYTPRDGGPLETMTVERSAHGYFECPNCFLQQTDSVNMQVSRQVVRWS